MADEDKLLGQIPLAPAGKGVAPRVLGEGFFADLGKLAGDWFKNMGRGFDNSFGAPAKPSELTVELGITITVEAGVANIFKVGANPEMKLELKRTL